jgi:hypothetical protein
MAEKKKHTESNNVKESKEEVVSKEKLETENKSSMENTTKVIFVILGILLVGLAIWAYSEYSSAKYNYLGVEFTKAREGKIDFYTAKVPTLDNAANIVGYANVDFRSNPKSLGDIPVDFKTPITFIKSKTVYVSVPENLSNCNGYSGVALINFGRFLALFGLDVRGAVDDKNYTGNKETPYVNCKTNRNNTVIMVRDGEKTQIVQTGNNCYEISFANCEALRSIERFELQMISEYMEKVTKKA